MRELIINNQGGSASLVMKLGENDRLDRLAIGMLTNNRIPGLLSVSPRRVDQEQYLYYGISSLTPLTSAYGALSGDKRLLLFLRSLCRLAAECHEYLLEERGLLLDPQYVYVQLADSSIQVAYLPLEGEGTGTSLFGFVRALVMAISVNFPQDSKLMSVLYRMVLAEEQFSAAALDEQLARLQTEGAIQTDRAGAAGAAPRQHAEPRRYTEIPVQRPAASVQEPVCEPEKKNEEEQASMMQKFFGSKQAAEKPAKEPKPAKEKTSKPQKSAKLGFGMNMAIPGMESAAEPAPEAEPEVEENDGGQKKSRFSLFQKKSVPAAESAVPVQAPVAPSAPAQPARPPMGGGYTCPLDSLDGAPATTALAPEGLGGGMKPLWLVRRVSGQRVQVTHSNFHIGRGQGLVDYCVPTSARYIGVDHAYIQIEGEQYLFVDNNSLNHSWLNGAQLEPSRPYPLKGGDQLRLADEYFDVVIG